MHFAGKRIRPEMRGAALIIAFGLPLCTAGLRASWRPAGALPGSVPPRSGPTASADAAGDVWLFGGYAETDDGAARAVVNDLHKHSEDGWETLLGDAEASADQPGPRLACASAILDGQLLLFGGWDPQEPGTGGVILDDVWSLDLATSKWKRFDAPMPQGPTSRHVAANVGGSVVVHTFRCSDSVLVWDPAAGKLREQPTSGSAPSSRGLHVAAAADDHTLLVFGGAAKDGAMCNDAFALDTRTWRWRQLARGPFAPRPSARAGACAAPLPGGGGMVMCCGAETSQAPGGGFVPRGDVWALVLDANGEGATWTKLLDDDAPDAPGPRNAATLTPCGEPGKKELLLHGGWRPFVSTYGDSHVLSIE